MLRRYMLPMLGLVLGGMCLSFNSGYDNNSNRSSSNYPQDVKPGVSDEYYDSKSHREQATGREEVAYTDERDRDIHQRANRKGDWGYKQNWRYDREAFYKGETQGEAYDREHPDGVGGPGMDPDTEFLQMRKFYLEEQKRQAAANRAHNAAHSPNNSNSANRSSNQSRQYGQPYQSGNPNYHSNYNNPQYNQNYYPNDNSDYPANNYRYR